MSKPIVQACISLTEEGWWIIDIKDHPEVRIVAEHGFDAFQKAMEQMGHAMRDIQNGGENLAKIIMAPIQKKAKKDPPKPKTKSVFDKGEMPDMPEQNRRFN